MIAAAPRTTVIIVAMLFVLALGLASYQTNGFATWSGRLGGTSTEQLTWNYQTNTACLEKVKTKPMFCIQLGNTERITLGILGDSTANSLVPGLADYAEARNTGVINIGQGSCPPIRGMLPTPNNPDCPAIVAEAYRIILQDPKIDTVILALFTNDLGGLRFRNFPEGAPLEAHMNKLMAMLDADIHALHAAGKKVILTYDTPLSPVDAKECLHRLLRYCRGMQRSAVWRNRKSSTGTRRSIFSTPIIRAVRMYASSTNRPCCSRMAMLTSRMRKGAS